MGDRQQCRSVPAGVAGKHPAAAGAVHAHAVCRRGKDRSPRRVGRWTTAVGLDGDPFDIPAASTVTSRLSDAGAAQRHYALVCRSGTSLQTTASQRWFDDQHLRNLLSGAPVGASQVTSVVQSVPSRQHRRRYHVAFSAQSSRRFRSLSRDCVPVPYPAFRQHL